MVIKSLIKLLEENKDEIYEAIRETLSPTFDGDVNPKKYDEIISRFLWLGCSVQFGIPHPGKGRYLFPKQAETVTAAEKFLERNKSIIVSGETGTGKTYMGVALLSKQEYKNVVLIVPPHLVNKWAREIDQHLSGKCDYRIIIVNSYKDVLPLTKKGELSIRDKSIYIIPKTTNKLSYKTRPAAFRGIAQIEKTNEYKGGKREFVINSVYRCPKCAHIVYSAPLSWHHETCLKKLPQKCPKCKEKLHTPANHTISPAEFIARYGRRIDLLINDEIHEEKAKDTLTANAFGKLIPKAKKVVGLTGTLLGGYASHAFYTLFRMFPRLFRQEMGLRWEDVKWFKQEYGGFEELYEAVIDGSDYKKGRKYGVKERPDLSPRLLDAILPCSVFLRLDEIKYPEGSEYYLPDYKEIVHRVECEEEILKPYLEYLSSIAEAYRVADYAPELISKLANDGLLVPDMPDKEIKEEIEVWNKFKSIKERHTLHYSPLFDRSIKQFTNKEEKLIEIIEDNFKRNRKVLVYVNFVQKGMPEELMKVLRRAFPYRKIAHLSSKVPAREREAWLHKKNADLLITNPELVKTGLDLLQYPTIIFYQMPYNVFTLRQAQRRSWRIGQKEPVEVHTIVYASTAQSEAAKLIGGKINISQGIEGRLSTGEDMASMAEDENLQVALARRLLAMDKTSKEEASSETVATFSNNRDWEPFEEYYLKRLEEFLKDPESFESWLKVKTKPAPKPKKESKVKVEEDLKRAFKKGLLFEI